MKWYTTIFPTVATGKCLSGKHNILWHKMHQRITNNVIFTTLRSREYCKWTSKDATLYDLKDKKDQLLFNPMILLIEIR